MSLFLVTSLQIFCRVNFSNLVNLSLSRMTKEFDTSTIFWTSSSIDVTIHRFSSITSIEKITFLFENSFMFWIIVNKFLTNIIKSIFSSKIHISSRVWYLIVNITSFSSNLAQIWLESLSIYSRLVLSFKNRLVLSSKNLSFTSRLVIISFSSRLVLSSMNYFILVSSRLEFKESFSRFSLC